MGWKASGGGTDADAIHDNVAGEIAAIAAATPDSADSIVFEDDSDSDNKKSSAFSDIDLDQMSSGGAADGHVATADGAGAVAWEEGGGGGGGSGVTEGWSPLLDIKPGAADTADDDFATGSLDGKWTAVSGSSGTVSLLSTSNLEIYDLATRPGWLLIQVGRSGAQDVSLRQDFTLPDGESIVMALAPSVGIDGATGLAVNQGRIAVVVNNNNASSRSGTYLECILFPGTDKFIVTTWDGATSFDSGVDGSGVGGGFIYLRIARSGTTYYPMYSHSLGGSWIPLGAGYALGSAMDNIWITFESLAAHTSLTPIIAVDWIRQGSNSYDPWSAASSVSVIGDGTELTIAAGVVTVTSGFHTVDTETDAATDDLDTISGGSIGHLLVLKSAADARDPTVKDATGNILLASSTDFTLSDTDDTITLIYDGTNWCEISRSDNS